MGIVKGSDMMGNQNEKLIDEKDEVTFDDRMVNIFGATESNGVTRILYSKERMSAQQAMKAEDGKKLIIYFDSVCFRGPSGGIILPSSHIETDKDGVEYDGAYGVVSAFIRRKSLVRVIMRAPLPFIKEGCCRLASEFNVPNGIKRKRFLKGFVRTLFDSRFPGKRK